MHYQADRPGAVRIEVSESHPIPREDVDVRGPDVRCAVAATATELSGIAVRWSAVLRQIFDVPTILW